MPSTDPGVQGPGSPVQLDILIPVYNEGATIVAVLDSLRRAVKTRCRVLICYDDENDDTLPALHGYPSDRFGVLAVKNSGRGPHAAVRTGFAAATAPAIVVFPADDTNNAGILDAMFDRFSAGCAIVAASRFMPNGRMEGCPWLKAVLVRAAAFSLHHIARVPTRDATNGFRLFSRDVIRTIQLESTVGFTYSLELLVKCHRLGWRIGEVPAIWVERTHGSSRFRVLRWLPAYLRWYLYAFATTLLRRGPSTVRMRVAPRACGGEAQRTSP